MGPKLRYPAVWPEHSVCSFATFCASAVHDCPEIPRGVDEMLFDSYLQSLPSINWDTDPRILLRAHVHRIAQADTTDEASSDSSEASQVRTYPICFHSLWCGLQHTLKDVFKRLATL